MVFVSRCIVSKQFSAEQLAGIASGIESGVLAKRRFELSGSFREREAPIFVFVVPRPVSLRCFDRRKVSNTLRVKFTTGRVDGTTAGKRLGRILDYVFRQGIGESAPTSIDVSVWFDKGELPIFLNSGAEHITLSFRPLLLGRHSTPQVNCERLNQMVSLYRSVTGVTSDFQVVDGSCRWRGDSRQEVLVFPEEEGDWLRIRLPHDKLPSISQEIVGFVSTHNAPVLVSTGIISTLELQKAWLENGPFEGGYLEYQVDDGPVDKSVQAAINGNQSLNVDFVPLFAFSPKSGPYVYVCAMISGSMAELVMGYTRVKEPVDESAFNSLIEDAGLGKLFAVSHLLD